MSLLIQLSILPLFTIVNTPNFTPNSIVNPSFLHHILSPNSLAGKPRTVLRRRSGSASLQPSFPIVPTAPQNPPTDTVIQIPTASASTPPPARPSWTRRQFVSPRLPPARLPHKPAASGPLPLKALPICVPPLQPLPSQTAFRPRPAFPAGKRRWFARPPEQVPRFRWRLTASTRPPIPTPCRSNPCRPGLAR